MLDAKLWWSRTATAKRNQTRKKETDSETDTDNKAPITIEEPTEDSRIGWLVWDPIWNDISAFLSLSRYIFSFISYLDTNSFLSFSLSTSLVFIHSLASHANHGGVAISSFFLFCCRCSLFCCCCWWCWCLKDEWLDRECAKKNQIDRRCCVYH